MSTTPTTARSSPGSGRGARQVMAAALALAGGVLPSCNIVAPAVFLVAGPEKIEARYQPDARRTHVIVIDDLKSRLPKRSLRDLIGRSAEEELLRQRVLTPDTLIASASASRAVADDRHGGAIPVADIGRRVGAEVVVYVAIDGWTISRDGTTASPSVQARIKVIDAANNKRLWPAGDEGYTLVVQPATQQNTLPPELAARSAMEQALAKQFGIALAQVFYKHEKRESATQ